MVGKRKCVLHFGSKRTMRIFLIQNFRSYQCFYLIHCYFLLNAFLLIKGESQNDDVTFFPFGESEGDVTLVGNSSQCGCTQVQLQDGEHMHTNASKFRFQSQFFQTVGVSLSRAFYYHFKYLN